MRDHDDLPYIVIERHSGGAGPFLWGALLGAGVALLLAPRSGAETQEEIREGVRRIRDTAQGRVNEARDTVTGTVTRARNSVFDRIDAVREGIEEQAERARQALDTGRRAANQARSELESRVAEARGTPAPHASRGAAPDLTVDEMDERSDLG